MKNLLINLSKDSLINMIEELNNTVTEQYEYIKQLGYEVMDAEQQLHDLQEDTRRLERDLCLAYHQITNLNVELMMKEGTELQRIRHQEMNDNDEIPNISWIDHDDLYEDDYIPF